MLSVYRFFSEYHISISKVFKKNFISVGEPQVYEDSTSGGIKYGWSTVNPTSDAQTLVYLCSHTYDGI